MWVARDEDGGLFLYTNKPVKGVHGWGADFNTPPDKPYGFMKIDGTMFPEVKWRDLKPKEVEVSITLKKDTKPKPEGK